MSVSWTRHPRCLGFPLGLAAIPKGGSFLQDEDLGAGGGFLAEMTMGRHLYWDGDFVQQVAPRLEICVEEDSEGQQEK